jgi:hypothetical protein
MATQRRDNTTVRWATLIASGVMACGFFVATLNGPQPATAVAQPTMVDSSTPARTQGLTTGGGNASAIPDYSLSNSPQRSSPSGSSRLRSRGS